MALSDYRWGGVYVLVVKFRVCWRVGLCVCVKMHVSVYLCKKYIEAVRYLRTLLLVMTMMIVAQG